MVETPQMRAARLATSCARFRGSCRKTAYRELTITLGAFIALIGAMYWFPIMIIPGGVIAGGLLVRLFIIQHDCGHEAFLPTRRENEYIGLLLSVLTLTPFKAWRLEHNIHHASSADIDRRGVGDIKLATVREYGGYSFRKRVAYRFLRNPVFLVFVGGPIYFAVLNRTPWGRSVPAAKVTRSILLLDLAIVIVYGSLMALFGAWETVLVFAPIWFVGSTAGVWLFYVQHQFEDVRWYRHDEWDFKTASFFGSSYYDLPRVFAWFTGEIGIHHIHHVHSMIPFYKLRACLDAHPELKDLNRLTFLKSVRHAFRLTLWDEERQRLVGYPP